MKYISAVLLFTSSIFTFGNPSRLGVPDELEATLFSSKELTPCVACLCVAPTGEVYAGIDQIGSLGKGAGFGRILRLTDQDNDGVSDGHTVYAEIDNPRGMISVGISFMSYTQSGGMRRSLRECFSLFWRIRMETVKRTVRPSIW